MLFLSLPIVNGDCEESGEVTINSRPAEYRLNYEEIEIRYRDEEVWQKRQILQVTWEGELATLFCK